MSLRLRLSLLYSLILAMTLAAFGFAVYWTQSQYTWNWLKQDLVVSSRTISQSILQTLQPRPPDNQPGGRQPPGSGSAYPAPGDAAGAYPPPQSASAGPPGNAPGGGAPGDALQDAGAISFPTDAAFQQESAREIVRVLDPDGVRIASPYGDKEPRLPLSEAGLQAVRSGQDWWETGEVGGEDVLIYNRPVHVGSRMVGILQVARGLTERSQSLLALRRALIVAAILATLAAFTAGWLLTGVTLQPIRRISETAREIGQARDFTRRVAHPGPPDEVGQLAATFNAMLAQLEEAYHRLERALAEQRNFVADVSHELRTPLTTLRGNLGLFERGAALPPEDQADILNDMVAESDRLIRLVNELLAAARLDAGRSLAREPLAVYPLLEDAWRQALRQEPEREITLNAGADLTVAGDRDALKQVLLILLDNALKHTAGPVAIDAASQDQEVVIAVRDQGPGIPPELQAHVFDRFYKISRAADGDDGETPGVGLGLAIAKTLVEGQGGAIRVESRPGAGSAMIVTLPAAA